MLSQAAQSIIREFLKANWENLTRKAQAIQRGAQLPDASPDEQYESALGRMLRRLASAAEGKLEATESNLAEIRQGLDRLCAWLFDHPDLPLEQRVPAEFWETPLGGLAARAYLWCDGDEFITPAEAAVISGRLTSDLAGLADRGTLTRLIDPSVLNPQRRTRYRRSEIETLPPIRKTAKKRSR